jgi:hypothetical protein
MSVSSLSGRRPKQARTLVVHHCQTARVQGKTLCPSSGIRLSRRGLDQLARGSFELIGRNTLNPQCPADRSAASGLREAFRSEMQVCPSTQLPLPYVSNEAVGRPHQPQQLGFVGFLSATQAGADRLAHISSLITSGTSPESLQCVCREPSQDCRRGRTRLSSWSQPSEDAKRLIEPNRPIAIGPPVATSPTS